MSKKVIINAKGSAELKEAIRIVSFETRKRSSSAFIVETLEKHPLIVKQMQKLKKLPIGNQ